MGKRWKRELERVQAENVLPHLQSASMVLEKQMQKEVWPYGMESINKLPKREAASLLATDSPFLDEDGLIKEGGRLAHANLTFGRKHPTLIPDSELGDALIGYLHQNAGHQGRKVSAALIRDEGYSVIGGRGRIQRIIACCVTCRTLSASPMTHKMADLPEYRLWKTPLFYHCGIDVFGHFAVTHGRRTRGNPGVRKVWILLITCLYTRAVHLEMLDSMDSASFRMAFTRFEAVRGEC